MSSTPAHPSSVLRHSGLFRIGIPILAGGLIALTCTLLMYYIHPKWMILILGGIFVVAGSLVVKDSQKYWLWLFLLSLPLDIHKDFLPKRWSDYFLGTFGLPWGTATLLLQLSDIFLFFLFLCWLRTKLNTGERVYWPVVNWVAVAFLVWATLGTLLSRYPLIGVLELVRQYKYFVTYIVISNSIPLRKVVKTVVLLLLIQLFVQSGVTIVRYKLQFLSTMFGDTFGRTDPVLEEESVTLEGGDADKRGIGTFSHPNMTAMHFEFVLFAPFLVFATYPGLIPKAGSLALFLFGVTSLAVTFSRGGMAGFLCGLVVCLFVLYLRRMVPRRVMLAVFLAALFVSPLVFAKLSSYFQTRPEYFEERLRHWNAGLDLLKLNPILGTGLNTSTAMRAEFSRKGPQPMDDFLPLHNHYLIALSEVGVVGFLFYAGFFAYVGVKAFGLTGSATDYWVRIFALAVLATYSALVVHMTVDFLHADGLHTLFWFYAALIVGYLRPQDGGVRTVESAATAQS